MKSSLITLCQGLYSFMGTMSDVQNIISQPAIYKHSNKNLI